MAKKKSKRRERLIIGGWVGDDNPAFYPEIMNSIISGKQRQLKKYMYCERKSNKFT